MRLSEASETFLSVRAQEGFSRYTINAYRLQHELLVRDIGDLDIEDVTLQILRDHLNHHGHLKPTSVGHKIQAVRTLQLASQESFTVAKSHTQVERAQARAAHSESPNN